MITKREDYRYVTGADIGKIMFDGRIMPLRDTLDSAVLRGEDICFLLEAGQERSNAIRAVRFPTALESEGREWRRFQNVIEGTRDFTRRIDGVQAYESLANLCGAHSALVSRCSKGWSYDAEFLEYAYKQDLQYIDWNLWNIYGVKEFPLSWSDAYSVGPGKKVAMEPISLAFDDTRVMYRPFAYTENYFSSCYEPGHSDDANINIITSKEAEIHNRGTPYPQDFPWGYFAGYSGDSAYFNLSTSTYYTPSDDIAVEFDAGGVLSPKTYGMFRVSYDSRRRFKTEQYEAAVVIGLESETSIEDGIVSVRLPQGKAFVDRVASMLGAELWRPPSYAPSYSVYELCSFTIQLRQIALVGNIGDRTKWWED